MIQAQGLSVRYDDGRLALNHVSFAVSAGEVYCVLGLRGAGKTTLVNTFLGLISPATGKALIGRVNCGSQSSAARKKLALLSEKPPVYEYLSCRGNIELLARLSGEPIPSQDELIWALRQVSLPDRVLESRAKGLPPVWRQKLLLAAALLRKVPALFLDDPTGLLDAIGAKELIHELRKFKALGVAIMLATDDPLVARDLADHIGVLDRGLITRELDPHAISNEDMYSAFRSI